MKTRPWSWSRPERSTASSGTCTRTTRFASICWGWFTASGDSTLARDFFEQALALRRKLVADRHPKTVETLNALAWLDEAEGDLARSRRLFERALELHRDIWKLEQKQLDAQERSSRANLLERLARVLEEEGDLSGARDVLMQALAARGEWVKALAGPPAPGPSPRGRPSTGGGLTRASSMQSQGTIAGFRKPRGDTRARPSAFGLPGRGQHRFGPGAPANSNALMDPDDEMVMTQNPTHPWSLRSGAWYEYRLASEGMNSDSALPAALTESAWLDRAIAASKLRGRACIDFARSLGRLADVLRAR